MTPDYQSIEELKAKHELNMIRVGHLHIRDWNLIVSALQNLVICCEDSEAKVYGNLRERSHSLQKDIRHFILEDYYD